MADARPEPSMEDILASIKRIIADDTPAPRAVPGAATNGYAPPIPALTQAPALRQPPAPPPPFPQRADDSVLELTDLAPRQPARTAAPPPPPPGPSASAPPPPRERSYAMNEQLAAAPAMTGGGTTVEGLVREMLRPMLNQWIEAHLPSIVERLVQQEIERMSDEKR